MAADGAALDVCWTWNTKRAARRPPATC